MQQKILTSRSAWSDLGLIKETLQRYDKLAADKSSTWRLARARWLLRADGSESAAVEAVELLRPLVDTTPGAVTPRLLLARALRKVGDTSAALHHASRAANERPDAVGLRLQVARLAQADRQFDRALDAINRAVRQENVSERHRRTAARLLLRQGNASRAVEILKRLYGQEDTPKDLLLARAYRQQGLLARAERIGRKLVESPTPRRIAFLADLLARRGRMAEARKVLDRRHLTDASVGEKNRLRARFLTNHGSARAALDAWRAATQASPKSPESWRGRIKALVDAGRADEVARVIEASAEALPDPRRLRSAEQHKELIRVAAAHVSFQHLGKRLVRESSPGRRTTEDILRTLRSHTEDGDRSLWSQLRRLANDAQRRPFIQRAVAAYGLRIGRPKAAARLARRAMHNAPTSARAAKLAATASARAGQWSQALGAAAAWEGRRPAGSASAAVLASRACRRIGLEEKAVQKTKPYVPAAVERPAAHASVIEAHARALLGVGRRSEAADLLRPLLEKASRWRRLWARLAARRVEPPAAAARWLEQAAAVGAGTPAERLGRARAWLTLADRSGSEAHRKKAVSIARELRRSARSARALVRAGRILDRAGRREEATKAYEAALARGPESPVALNNLAMRLANRDGHLDTALSLAKEALKKQTRPSILDTLARIRAKRGEHKKALSLLKRAIESAPNEPEWRLARAEILLRAEKTNRASEGVDRLMARHEVGNLRDPLRKRLARVRDRIEGSD